MGWITAEEQAAACRRDRARKAVEQRKRTNARVVKEERARRPTEKRYRLNMLVTGAELAFLRCAVMEALGRQPIPSPGVVEDHRILLMMMENCLDDVAADARGSGSL